MSKQSHQQLKTFLLGFLIIVGVSVVSAWTGPTSNSLSTSNTPAPIDVSAAAQAKGKATPTTGTLFDINGILAATGLAVWGNANIQGNLTLGQYSTSTVVSNRRLCAEGTGRIILCGQQNFAYTTPGTYSFTVPSGVTEIVVELYGGGGAGFSDYYTVSNTTANESGTDSSFISTDGGTKANLIARGGKVPTGKSIGGVKGTYVASGTQITSNSSLNGTNGSAPATPGAQTYLCRKGGGGSYANHELWLGGNGGTGGKGGGAGGGAGGAGALAPSRDASSVTLTSNSCAQSLLSDLLSIATYGVNWIEYNINNGGGSTFYAFAGSEAKPTTGGGDGATPGAGGGGSGGIAGITAFDAYTSGPSMQAYNTGSDIKGLCYTDSSSGSGTYNVSICGGKRGVPGGGSGGYVKTTLSVTPGDTYTLVVGKGGAVHGFGTYWTDPSKNSGYDGVYSGKGADGAINVTYN